MKMISTDRLLEDLRKVYEKAGWDPRECHFSLLDMECNIDGQYGMERVTISTSEVVPNKKIRNRRLIKMIHWAWLLLSFVIGTWVGMILTALLKANNPDFFEEEEEKHG